MYAMHAHVLRDMPKYCRLSAENAWTLAFPKVGKALEVLGTATKEERKI